MKTAKEQLGEMLSDLYKGGGKISFTFVPNCKRFSEEEVARDMIKCFNSVGKATSIDEFAKEHPDFV